MEGKNMIVSLNESTLPSALMTHLRKLLDMMSTNPNVQMGIITCAGIMGTVISILALLEPDVDERRTQRRKKTSRTVRSKQQKQEQKTVSSDPTIQNPISTQEGTEDVKKTIQPAQKRSFSLFGIFGKRQGVKRRQDPIEVTKGHVAVMAKENFETTDTITARSDILILTPPKFSRQSGEGIQQLIRPSTPLSAKEAKEVSAELDHIVQAVIPPNENIHFIYSEYAVERANLKQSIQNLENNIEELQNYTTTLKQAKNLLEGQLKAESTLRAEAEENLSLLRSEYEKQLKNLEELLQREKRKNSHLNEKVHILETKINYIITKKANSNSDTESNKTQKSGNASSEEEEEEFLNSHHSGNGSSDEVNEKRFDRGHSMLSSSFSIGDEDSASVPSISAPIFQSPTRKLAMSAENMVGLTTSPHPNLLIYGQN